MPDQKKDRWDKFNIFLTPVGGFLTALAVGLVGYFGTHALNSRQAEDAKMLDRRQAADTNARLYAQLMSQREDAETSLRKDMFNSIIGSFLKPGKKGYEQQVLNLELLTYNFHEALDLAPLFQHVYAQIGDSQEPRAREYLRRLEKAANEGKNKQIAALEVAGGKLDGTVYLKKVEGKEPITVIDRTLGTDALDPDLRETHFKVEVQKKDLIKKELQIKLTVKTPQKNNAGAKADEAETIATFWITPFDFPMIDNTRLPHGQRCAIVLRSFPDPRAKPTSDPSAQITLVYFPGSRASLKEKPFLDEVILQLLNTQDLLERRQK